MKLVWTRRQPGLIVYAGLAYDHGPSTSTGLREDHMAPVQIWCEEHRCGRRIAFDMFKFRSEAELAMFLLKWS